MLAVRRKVFLVLVPLAAPCAVSAHGTLETPLSRVYSCYLEGPEAPTSAACKAAVAVAGPSFLYDWAGVNQLPNGDHKSFVPDGHLCSGGKTNYYGLDLVRNDWPTTTISADLSGNYTFVWNATAPHVTRYFQLYMTNDGYDFNQPLKWSDLDSKPFCEINSVTLENSRYKLQCKLPSGKTGRRIIYAIWQRNDSAEAFCTFCLLKSNRGKHMFSYAGPKQVVFERPVVCDEHFSASPFGSLLFSLPEFIYLRCSEVPCLSLLMFLSVFGLGYSSLYFV
ncbi:lytic polysaccharide monooxygenase auxiliary activity family 9 protein [Candidatus Burkholderia verschuerenii]|uniref:lytic polysaccharide monooxygenase auxiliary activity family 9 protein n=1 Tax=Candidatus Burkholderia verschuerenii TaxID=242163 RepID=UPI0009F81581